APVARRGLPVLRWPEPGQQHVPARRGRCQDPGGSGAHGVAAAVRAARACLHVCLRAGLGAFPAAVRLGSRRGVGGGAHLRHGARQHAVSALALRRLAENTTLKRHAPAPPLMLVTLKTLLHTVLLPPGGPLLVAGAGAWLARSGVTARARRAGWLLLAASLVVSW